jgi:hypothetical protein
MVDLFAHDDYFRALEEQKLLSLGQITTEEIETCFARQKFIIAICYSALPCLDNLKQIFNSNHSLVTALLNKTKDRFPASIKEILPFSEGKELYELLINWSKDWNINVEWIIESALITILSWFHKPQLRDELYWYINHERLAQALIIGSLAKIRMEMDPNYTWKYDPFSYKSKKEFQKQKKDKELEDLLFAKYGLKRTVKKEQRHFEWLVQYLLLKMSPKEIADKMINNNKKEYKNIEPESIKKAIKKTAKLIGIKI